MDCWLGQRASYLLISWWSKCFDFPSLSSHLHIYMLPGLGWVHSGDLFLLLGMIRLSAMKDKIARHMGCSFPVR